MNELDFREIISTTGYAIEGIGVVVIVIGILTATLRYTRHYITGSREELYRDFRRDIGRALMVGLEFLVAGATAVAHYGGIPPYRETQGYVERVLNLYRRYDADFR